jgi:hypothetical protein
MLPPEERAAYTGEGGIYPGDGGVCQTAGERIPSPGGEGRVRGFFLGMVEFPHELNSEG